MPIVFDRIIEEQIQGCSRKKTAEGVSFEDPIGRCTAVHDVILLIVAY